MVQNIELIGEVVAKDALTRHARTDDIKSPATFALSLPQATISLQRQALHSSLVCYLVHLDPDLSDPTEISPS
jgi:hypothetical protein